LATIGATLSDLKLGKLLVTGVPGWLSGAFLRSIAEHPLPGLESVRCLVQPGSELAERPAVDAEIVRGDMRDSASLERAVRGIDTILHTAALIHVDRIRDYYEVNTEGTRRLGEHAARAGVRRFVYVSTNAAGGRAPDAESLIREADPDRPLSHYGRSKLLAEKWLLATPGSMQAVVLRPCMFYGPPVPPRHVDVYRRIMRGRMPLVGGGGYARSVVFIDNLVACVRLALVKAAAAGNVYYVADRHPSTTRGVVEAMARALGVAPRFVRLPAIAADAAYWTDQVFSMGDRYLQTVHLVGEGNWNVGVSIDKARRELGYEPGVAIDEGMQRAVDWCRARNLLEPQARFAPVQ
jgi:nucleoside-diphosphate-sugar epimerase